MSNDLESRCWHGYFFADFTSCEPFARVEQATSKSAKLKALRVTCETRAKSIPVFRHCFHLPDRILTFFLEKGDYY